MQRIHSILYLSSSPEADGAALRQALQLAREHQARLHVLISYPGLPKAPKEHVASYEQYLRDQVQGKLFDPEGGTDAAHAQVSIAVENGSMPALRAIQLALREGFDLIAKRAEPQASGKGFRAIDMELLRKCPVPVWLFRERKTTSEPLRYAVAVDPVSEEAAGTDLAVELLRTAEALTELHKAELHIVSCWDYPYENYLNSSAFVRSAADEIKRMVDNERQAHLQALQSLIAKAGLRTHPELHHLRGAADAVIADFARTQCIDLLIMGSVARTGIPGFVIGNTAENILQTLDCSLLTMKPKGFISPIKAYS